MDLGWIIANQWYGIETYNLKAFKTRLKKRTIKIFAKYTLRL